MKMVAESPVECDGEQGCLIQAGQRYVETTWGLNPPPFRYCLDHYNELAELAA